MINKEFRQAFFICEDLVAFVEVFGVFFVSEMKSGRLQIKEV